MSSAGNVYWYGLLAQYVDWKVYACPGFENSNPFTPFAGPEVVTPGAGYGISQFGLDGTSRIDKGMKLARIRNQCINFACTDQIKDRSSWVGPQGPRSGGPAGDERIPLGTSGKDSLRCVQPIHGMNNNFAFTDGHVEARKADGGTQARDWNPDYPKVAP